jgi:hypothetical protein
VSSPKHCRDFQIAANSDGLLLGGSRKKVERRILLALLIVCGTAEAQSVAEAKYIVQKIDVHVTDLSNSAGALAKSRGAPWYKQDEPVLERIVAIWGNLQGWVFAAQSTGRVATQMQSSEDSRLAIKEFRLAADFLNQQADMSAFEVSEELPRMTIPSLVADATRVRDSMLALRNDTQSIVGKSVK